MKTRLYLGVAGALIVAVLFTACERPRGVYSDKLNVLGTFADIAISGLPDAEARQAARDVEKELRKYDHVGYTFESRGELHELNAVIAKGESMIVTDELRDLINSARQLYRESGGLFNPAAGKLTALWEFHCNKEDCEESPYPAEVQRLMEEKEAEILALQPSMDDLVLDGNEVTSRNVAVKLEFGDMIRGYALDRGISRLKEQNIGNAMIDIGGSIRSLGSRGDHPWWVALLDVSGKHSVGYVEMGGDEAIVTARAFDRSIGKQDFVYRHVIDPRTGLPVKKIKAVSVMHNNALQANAAATALLVAGMENWASVAEKMSVHSVLMIDHDGTIYTSTAMEERIHWNQRLDHQHLVP